MTELSPESVAGWMVAAAGVAALAITWWRTARDARAEQPVLWLLTPERSAAPFGAKHSINYAVRISPGFADARSFRMELYHPGESGMPGGLQYTSSSARLKVGESEVVQFVNGTRPGTAWVPRGWEGLEPRADEEHLHQGTRPMTWQWLLASVLPSPDRLVTDLRGDREYNCRTMDDPPLRDEPTITETIHRGLYSLFAARATTVRRPS